MGHLAITGGTPVFDRPLQPQWPQFDERDEKALRAAGVQAVKR